MEICSQCKWKYPGRLLSDFISSQGNHRVCGLCALELSNELHATNGVPPRKKFSGPLAEKLRLDGLHWRKKHPEYKPK